MIRRLIFPSILSVLLIIISLVSQNTAYPQGPSLDSFLHPFLNIWPTQSDHHAYFDADGDTVWFLFLKHFGYVSDSMHNFQFYVGNISSTEINSYISTPVPDPSSIQISIHKINTPTEFLGIHSMPKDYITFKVNPVTHLPQIMWSNITTNGTIDPFRMYFLSCLNLTCQDYSMVSLATNESLRYPSFTHDPSGLPRLLFEAKWKDPTSFYATYFTRCTDITCSSIATNDVLFSFGTNPSLAFWSTIYDQPFFFNRREGGYSFTYCYDNDCLSNAIEKYNSSVPQFSILQYLKYPDNTLQIIVAASNGTFVFVTCPPPSGGGEYCQNTTGTIHIHNIQGSVQNGPDSFRRLSVHLSPITNLASSTVSVMKDDDQFMLSINCLDQVCSQISNPVEYMNLVTYDEVYVSQTFSDSTVSNFYSDDGRPFILTAIEDDGFFFHALPVNDPYCPSGTQGHSIHQEPLLSLSSPNTSFNTNFCSKCPAGYRGAPLTSPRNQENCIPCAKNFYSPVEKSPSCTKCPTGTNTLDKPSTRCRCSPSYWYPEPAGNPSPNPGGTNRPIGTACRTCPIGGTCLGNIQQPFPSPGYYSSSESNTIFLPCTPFAACAGKDKCNPGYEDFLCSVCSKNYYRINTQCKPCPETPVIIFVIVGLLFFFSIIGMIVSSSRGQKFGAPTIILTYLQILALFGKIDLPAAPPLWYNFFDILSPILFSFEAVAPECAVPLNYWGKFVFQILLPVILFFLLGFLWAITSGLHYIIPPKYHSEIQPLFERTDSQDNPDDDDCSTYGCATQNNDHSFLSRLQHWSLQILSNTKQSFLWFWTLSTRGWKVLFQSFVNWILDNSPSQMFNYYQGAYMMFLLLLYAIITRVAFESLYCEQRPDGTWFLVSAPNATCRDENWYSYMWLSILVIIFYTIGFPVFITYFVIREKPRLNDWSLRMKFGAFYDRFDHSHPYFEAISMTRKFGIILLILLLPKERILLTLFCLIITLIALAFHHRVKPYWTESLNRMEYASLISSSIVLTVSFIFSIGSDFVKIPAIGIALSIIAIISVVITIPIFIVHLHAQFLQTREFTQELKSAENIEMGSLGVFNDGSKNRRSISRINKASSITMNGLPSD